MRPKIKLSILFIFVLSLPACWECTTQLANSNGTRINGDVKTDGGNPQIFGNRAVWIGRRPSTANRQLFFVNSLSGNETPQVVPGSTAGAISLAAKFSLSDHVVAYGHYRSDGGFVKAYNFNTNSSFQTPYVSQFGWTPQPVAAGDLVVWREGANLLKVYSFATGQTSVTDFSGQEYSKPGAVFGDGRKIGFALHNQSSPLRWKAYIIDPATPADQPRLIYEGIAEPVNYFLGDNKFFYAEGGYYYTIDLGSGALSVVASVFPEVNITGFDGDRIVYYKNMASGSPAEMDSFVYEITDCKTVNLTHRLGHQYSGNVDNGNLAVFDNYNAVDELRLFTPLDYENL